MKSLKRFYPMQYPVIAKEPTKDKFKLVTLKEFGEGIMSLDYFKSGNIVGSYAILLEMM